MFSLRQQKVLTMDNLNRHDFIWSTRLHLDIMKIEDFYHFHKYYSSPFLGSRTIELHFKNLFTGWRNLWMYSDNTVKEEAKQARKVCPYGCEKSWKNIYTLSVKRHILFKCPKIDGQTKVAEFFKKKKRLSISDVVFWIFRLGMGLNQIVISWLFWLCFFSQVIFFVV